MLFTPFTFDTGAGQVEARSHRISRQHSASALRDAVGPES
jgi:hypothetical protein